MSEAQESRRVCLGKEHWAAYDLDSEGRLIDTFMEDDPDTAARVAVAKGWTSGTHHILVANSERCHTYTITLDTEEVER